MCITGYNQKLGDQMLNGIKLCVKVLKRFDKLYIFNKLPVVYRKILIYTPAGKLNMNF